MPKAAILLLILFLGLLFWYKPILHLQNLLKDESIDNLNLNGKTYSVFKGRVYIDKKELSLILNKEEYQKVLQLASFYQLTKEDPLFIPYHIDIPELTKSIEFMENKQAKFLSDLKVKDNIFPTGFLKLLPLIASTQKEFIDSPGDALATQLINLYFQATLEYRKNAGRQLEIIKNTIDKNKGSEKLIFAQFATTTNPLVVINDFKTIIDNSFELERNIQKRADCINKGHHCRLPLSQVLEPAIKQANATSFNLIPKEKAMFFTPDDQIRGPYQIKSYCLGFDNRNNPPSYLYYVASQFGIGGMNELLYPEIKDKVQYAKLATDSFFLKLIDRYVHERFFIEHGLLFVPQLETNPYICQNLEYLATIGQIDATFSKKQFLFTDIPDTLPSNIRQSLLELGKQEQGFSNLEYPSDYELEKLGFTYLKAYQILKAQKKYREADRFLQEYLDITFKMSDFYKIINKLAVNLSNFGIKRNFEVENNFKDLYYYGFRSAYSLTYLIFSPGTWKNATKPQYIVSSLKNNFGFDKRYLTYTQMRERYSDKEIFVIYEKEQELNKLYLNTINYDK